MRLARTIIGCCLSGCILGAGCPLAPLPEPEQPPVVDPLAEVEPNGEVTTAQALDFSQAEAVRPAGTLADDEDVDFYNLGPLAAGDRVTVVVHTLEATPELSLVLFESEADFSYGTLVTASEYTVNADETAEAGTAIDVTLRHAADVYYLGVVQQYTSLGSGGPYDLTVWIRRGGETPATGRQAILIDFDGGVAQSRAGEVPITRFDAAAIDPIYALQDELIKQSIMVAVRENFAGYGVDIYSTDENPDLEPGEFSTVFIGQLESGEPPAASEGLGVAFDGVDAFNADPSDSAMVFARSFRPGTFNLVTPPDPWSLGIAMGNVASHEAGHLLGLHHAFDPSDVMNSFDAPIVLLLDQRFKKSAVDFVVFNTTDNYLTQDGALLLQETVGRTLPAADVLLPLGDTPFDFFATDVDNDADVDLVVGNRFSSTLSILRNDGTGALTQEIVPLSGGPIALLSFDADGDSDPDLMAAHPATSTIDFLRNTGGSFALEATFAVGNRPRNLAAADFNVDGDLDVAVASFESHDVTVLSNDGTGAFISGMPAPAGQNPHSIIAADFNRDGLPDLLVTNFSSGDLTLLLNNANFGFDSSQLISGLLPVSTTAADLDGDGDLDLATACGFSSITTVQFAGEVSVRLNDGAGSFGPPTGYLTGAIAEAIASGDMDGDGDVDLAVATSGDPFVTRDLGQISLLFNRGDATFSQDVVLLTGETPSAVVLSDLDNDGDLDLATTNRDSDTLGIYFNHGGGQFGTPVELGPLMRGTAVNATQSAKASSR
ncbi:MAG: hypothetical protein AMXMBFR13_04400 [Phycisphaerae bacterium]